MMSMLDTNDNPHNLSALEREHFRVNQADGAVKWTFKQFKSYLETVKARTEDKKFKSLDVEDLFDRIHDLVIKTVISVEPLLWNGIEMFLPNSYDLGHSQATTD